MRAMNTKFLSIVVVLALPAIAGADAYKVPHTADGHPDLQGTWTNATLTPVERPKTLGDRLVLNETEALQMEQRMKDFAAASDQPSDLSQELPKGGGVGGYNVFWFDPANKVATVNGERRSSLIVWPTDGQVPELSEPGKQRLAARTARAAQGAFDGPEQRALGERCILGFGSNSGPPMLPVMYNSNYQIVQNRDTVLITSRWCTTRASSASAVSIRRRTFASGWAIRSGAGRARRWWSRPRTSIRRNRFRSARAPRIEAFPCQRT
jgi:hypothetical protein